MRPALVKRTLQFRAGPQTQTFYACWEHAHTLEGAPDVPNFMPAPNQDTQPVDDDEWGECDFCD